MALCQFSRTFTDPAAELLARAQKAIQAQGGSLTGDATKGTFTVSRYGRTVAGSYTVLESTIHFDVTRMDWPATCGLVQTTVDGFLKPPPPPPQTVQES
jgi:hypothetical protein